MRKPPRLKTWLERRDSNARFVIGDHKNGTANWDRWIRWGREDGLTGEALYRKVAEHAAGVGYFFGYEAGRRDQRKVKTRVGIT